MRPTLLREKILSLKSKGKKAFAVLIDPEKAEEQNNLLQLIRIGVESKIDFFLVGGSLLTANNLSTVIQTIKKNCEIPVILFPGSNMQIDLSCRWDLALITDLWSQCRPTHRATCTFCSYSKKEPTRDPVYWLHDHK